MELGKILEFRRDLYFEGAVQADWFYSQEKAAKVAENFVFHGKQYFGVEDQVPMTMILQPGIVKLHLENEIKEAAIHAGFVEILPDKISMMAEVAEWPDEIDLNRAKEAAQRAERRLQAHDPKINMSRAELALKRALVRQELAGK